MTRGHRNKAQVKKIRKATTPGGLGRLEWMAAILLTVVVLFSHVELFRHAGGLWRDEVNTLNLSTMPSLRDIWRLSQFDSFPLLWFLVVRGWTALSSAANDTSLRVLGMLVGLAIVAALWLNARKLLNFSVPLLALTLVGLNPSVIRWGDSLRAYGFGVLTILLAFGLLWRAFQSPTPWRVFLAMMSVLCAVHTLYYNAVLLFAIGTGCMIVGVRRRQWKRVMMVAGIGLGAAVTLLPYFVTVHRVRQWNMLVQVPTGEPHLWSKLCVPLGAQGQFMIWVWVAFGALAVATALVAQFRRRTPNLTESQRDFALFGGSALVIGAAGYVVFLKVLNYPTQPWYYLALMAFAALAMEVVLSVMFTHRSARKGRIILVAIVVVFSLRPMWRSLQARQTNIDLIAEDIGQKANQGDLIVVNDWTLGITFDHYYRGNAPWMTTPPIRDHKLHRYDLVKDLMSNPDALRPLLEAMGNTLRSGHRLWVVGALPTSRSGEKPQSLPPPPLPGIGWDEGPYGFAWARQAGYFVQTHALTGQIEQFGGQVNPYEAPVLEILEGWHSGPGK